MTVDFLTTMALASRERVEQAMRSRSEARMRALAQAAPPAPRLVLSELGFDLIAEVKQRSPARGPLTRDNEDIGVRVAAYADAGVAAISILTEPSCFDGSLAHVEQASRTLAGGIPIMRKDFVVDPYQVYEARLAGAGGVLIILRMLASAEIWALLDVTAQLGLFSLLETFDERDIELAHTIVDARLRPTPHVDGSRDQLLVGINCRDLATLTVVPGRLEQFAHRLPSKVPRVAESGVGSAEDAARVARAGYDLALVGSALMTDDNPAALARAMLTAGRAAREGGTR